MELWDAYDAMGRKTGKTLVRGEEVPQGLYHLVVHIWYRNSRGELLIQRRALSREFAPGLWATTGGSAVQGEDIEQALLRESQEEMGIVPDLARSMHVLSYRTKDTLTEVFLVPFDGDASSLHLQEEEVMDARWITPEELRSMIGSPEKFWQYRYLGLLMRFLEEHPAEGGWNEVSPV